MSFINLRQNPEGLLIPTIDGNPWYPEQPNVDQDIVINPPPLMQTFSPERSRVAGSNMRPTSPYFHKIWDAIHNYDPDEWDSEKAKDFTELQIAYISCLSCRRHYHAYTNNNPIDYSSAQGYRNYFFTLHNHINQINNKPTFSPEEFKAKYGKVITWQ